MIYLLKEKVQSYHGNIKKYVMNSFPKKGIIIGLSANMKQAIVGTVVSVMHNIVEEDYDAVYKILPL